MKKNIVSLSNQTIEIILGSLLGDGSLKIHKGYINARFSIKHSITQEKYFYWKIKQLKEISSENCVFKQHNDKGYSKNDKLRYQSLALESLSELYNLTSKRGKLRIRRKWLNRLSPLSLAIWWLDDGSIIANGRKGVFCTDGFAKKDVEIISKYLKVVWKIKTNVSPVFKKKDDKKEEYFRIWINSTEELKKILRIILPYIKVKEMLYKIILLYKDQQLQQRWISEISLATGFSKNEITENLNSKKEKWKNFRK